MLAKSFPGKRKTDDHPISIWREAPLRDISFRLFLAHISPRCFPRSNKITSFDFLKIINSQTSQEYFLEFSGRYVFKIRQLETSYFDFQKSIWENLAEFEIWAECAPRNVVLSRCGMQHYRRRNYCARGTIVNWGINISLFRSHETIFLNCFALTFAIFTIVTSTRSSNATFYRTCQILWENRIAKITRMNQPAVFFSIFLFRYFCHC